MKMRLKNPGTVPYGGGYDINRPELGMVGFGTAYAMLETRVRAYRAANGIPTGLGFSEELECVVCEKYPAECEGTSSILPLKRRLTLEDVVAGTKVLASFKAAGSPLVPQDEAIRRGGICDRCPLCVTFPKPCNGLCPSLKVVVDQIIASSYRTPYDEDPRSCSICSCYYSSHIRIPYEFLQKGLTDEQRAQFQEANAAFGCWKIPGAA